MITLIFKEDVDGQVYAVGYSTLGYSSSDKTEVLKKIEEDILIDLSGKNWKDNIYHLKLENEDIVFDETVEDI